MNLRSKTVPMAGGALAAAILAPSALAQAKDWRKIKYPKLPEFKIEKPVVFTMENGMTVFLMEDRELPLVTVNARIRTGSYYEPAAKVGLAGLAGAVMRTGGTATMSGDAIDAS